MLFPVDPAQRPELWNQLDDQLRRYEMVFPIHDGKADLGASSRMLSTREVDALVLRMKRAAVCRISANRGATFSPHFSGERYENCIRIVDFLFDTFWSGLQDAMEVAAISLLYERFAVGAVELPINIPTWVSENGLVVSSVPGGIQLRKAG